ncbi:MULTISPECIES: hypothetical protein [unclassified Solwaraspora]|nr:MULTISPECIES: hypothetical protein [unclassified Solwaraspora]WBB95241.1 hypothetical protein O7553_17715 [Solwaraspora sp. WMMA2059]WBC20853.1 hypothetical protein O7543_29635 [Solwaraspora sp. WMMA2080]WJK37014.1 hypothetical protein O7610_12060 [Solwaraspora sp. WMMA2065]
MSSCSASATGRGAASRLTVAASIADLAVDQQTRRARWAPDVGAASP